MKTDRELLTMAAREYWGDEIDDVCSIRWSDEEAAIIYTHADNQDHNGCDRERVWNPLDDDGDAFRLAVKLGLTINVMLPRGCNELGRTIVADCCQLHGDDPCAATRRAIVRAAAHIGEAMSNQLRTVAIDQSDAIEQYMGFPDERLWDQK